MVAHERITPKHAIELLLRPPKNRCQNIPPEQPMHGDWYIFTYESTPDRSRLWHGDGYTWKNNGLKKERISGHTLYKRYFRQLNGDILLGLNRIVFEIVSPPVPRYLIQYFDETLAVTKDEGEEDDEEELVTSRTSFRKRKKRKIKREPTRRRCFTEELSEETAHRLLLSKGRCCTTHPISRPSNGYWYVYKYDSNPAFSDDWQNDAMSWTLTDSNTFSVGNSVILKRRFIRLIGDKEVDFHRHSYEFVNATYAEQLSADTKTVHCMKREITCNGGDEVVNGDVLDAGLDGSGDISLNCSVINEVALTMSDATGNTLNESINSISDGSYNNSNSLDQQQSDECVQHQMDDNGEHFLSALLRHSATTTGPSSASSLPKETKVEGDMNEEEDEEEEDDGMPRTRMRTRSGRLRRSPPATRQMRSSRKRKFAEMGCDDDDEDNLLKRVLIHYFGSEEALSRRSLLSSTPRTKSEPERPLAQVALCRAVPLTCNESTLQPSVIGANRCIHRRLNAKEVARLLLDTPHFQCLAGLPIDCPKAGFWCVMETESHLLSGEGAIWRQDGFTWRPVGKARLSVDQTSLLVRRYRRTVQDMSVLLFRHVYCLLEANPRRVLVHYTGLDDDPEPIAIDAALKHGEPVSEADQLEDYDEEFDNSGIGRKPHIQEELDVDTDTTAVLARDGLSVMVVTRVLFPMEIGTIIKLLEETPEEDCLTFAPTNPKNGHWFIFSFAGLPTSYQKAWRRDYYRWQHNGTHRKVLGGRSFSIRYYKRVVAGRSCSFMKHTYELLDEEYQNVLKRVLVHYIGPDDREEYMPSKMLQRYGQGDSVIVKVGDFASEKYYTVECKNFVPDCDICGPTNVADDPELQAVASIMGDDLNPGDLVSLFDPTSSRGHDGYNTVIKNRYEDCTPDDNLIPNKLLEDVSVRYSFDDTDSFVSNTVPLAYRLPHAVLANAYEFLHKIQDTHSISFRLIPSLTIVISSKYNMRQFSAICSDERGQPVVFYDRSWRITDMQVSCLYAKHSFCVGESLFPLAFAVHELDDATSHAEVLRQAVDCCPCINASNVVVITDSSPNVLSACNEVFPKAELASSWANIFEAIKYWFSRNNPTSNLWGFTLDAIGRLLRTITIDDMCAIYQEVAPKWEHNFRAFYDESLSRIVNASNQGSFKRINMYTDRGLSIAGSIDLIRQVENMLNDGDTCSLDNLVSVLYFILHYYNNEIDKGKLVRGATVFKRKTRYQFQVSKRKCFFSNRSVLPEEVGHSILQKMGVPLSEDVKREADESPDTENVREVVNVEFSLDENLQALDDSDFAYYGKSEDDDDDVLLRCAKKRPLKFSRKSTLLGRYKESSEKKNMICRYRRSVAMAASTPTKTKKSAVFRRSKPVIRSTLYAKRKQVVSAGYALWDAGGVSYEPVSDSFIVRGEMSGKVHAVKLTSNRRECSCSRRARRCQHMVAALLEKLCREEPDDNDIDYDVNVSITASTEEDEDDSCAK